jgi:type IV pilus assembly protein PilX
MIVIEFQKKQKGVALFIVLMFLIVLSGLAAFSARNATFAERMARNQLDRSLAFQAAEAALRDAEADMFLRVDPAGVTCGRIALTERAGSLEQKLRFDPNFGQWTKDCQRGQCQFTQADLAAGTVPWSAATKGGKWNDVQSSKTACTFNGGVPYGRFTGATALRSVARQPEYLIENFEVNNYYYVRYTARGWGADARTEVLIQGEMRAEALLPG